MTAQDTNRAVPPYVFRSSRAKCDGCGALDHHVLSGHVTAPLPSGWACRTRPLPKNQVLMMYLCPDCKGAA